MSAGGKKLVVGWKLLNDSRAELLARFPPAYAQVVADHITLRSGVDEASLGDGSGELNRLSDERFGSNSIYRLAPGLGLEHNL